ncbi:hypothetical protein [Acholeplasma laidlawii]|uniref:hypothetical protein n=1 Tax=Acholeplasma laidlawii TaxID=2148 RepID=UPI0021F6CE9C|nr:hypothetical protein [Acholeplasma laidlawii]
MVKKNMILGMLIIMSLGFLIGCGEQNFFVISYNEIGSFGSKTIDEGITMHTLEMASSLQELKDLCDIWNNQAFQENSEYYTSELSQKLRSYNESFFSDHNLIVYSFERGHSKETIINNISVEDSELIIEASFITKKGTFTDEAFNWLILIEVNKTDATGVATIKVCYK